MPTDDQIPSLFQYNGSMTEQLETRTGAQIRILHRTERITQTFRFISNLLGQPVQQRLWQREVILGADTQWLFGRTVALPASRRPKLAPIQNLGDNPIGPVLFEQLKGRRVDAQCLRLSPAHPLIRALNSCSPLWSRLSLFSIGWNWIFVQETLLPDCPLT